MKVELVLRAAEALLATCQEGQKPEILAQLRDIKSRWEETVTYMTHCHRWGQSGGLIATSSDAGGSPCSLPYPLEDPHLSDSSSDSGLLGTACPLWIQASASNNRQAQW